jgi:hypothetical protein
MGPIFEYVYIIYTHIYIYYKYIYIYTYIHMNTSRFTGGQPPDLRGFWMPRQSDGDGAPGLRRGGGTAQGRHGER